MHTTPGTSVFPCTRSVLQLRAVFPQLPRKGSPLSGPTPSTGAWRGSYPQVVCPQPRKKSPFAGRVPLTAHRGVLTRGAACPEKRTEGSLLAGQVSSTVHAMFPTTGLCALNRGQRRPHSWAARPQAHTEVSPLEGRWPQLGMEGFRYALRAPWKTHRRVSTRGLTSSAAHGRLPTHGPCAFNRACSCAHHKAVCPQPPTQWLPLAGSELSCPHRGIPTDRPRTTKPCTDGASRLYASLNCTPRVPHLWATHGVVLTTRLCALNSHEGRPHSWATSCQMGTERSPLAVAWVVCLQPCTQWSPPQRCEPSIAYPVVPTRGPCTLNRT